MSGIGPGKGDGRRPTLVSSEELDANWQRTLPGKALEVCECGLKFTRLRNGQWYCKNGHVQSSRSSEG